MVEDTSQLRVESFVENTHVDNDSVPRVSGGQTVLSTKGLSTGNNRNETIPAVNTGVDNEFVPHVNGGQMVLSTKVDTSSRSKGPGLGRK